MKLQASPEALIELAYAKMHFGKYKGYFLSDVPEYYLVWYRQKGFPKGKTGEQMQEVFELKLNGMEGILRQIRKRHPKGR
ncbi:MAG: DUF3820 family protein [Salegentibacter sp.]|uniref:DUF3820 family protein n=1 Tax=Salegentibacter flavus TaxID=287099 RepID=A0A1I5BBV5_9FLAO|nr:MULTISPECIES: DUF3820 family protein [Salegentibacter]MDR9457267.1 DUF3820 family protein [Salegentibacter sp.]SFN72193.1 hypothetical protein SAMN05660413_02293 [Salegentibacter flavus]